MATNPYGIDPRNPDEESLNNFLTSMFLGGRDPGQVAAGIKHPMDPSFGKPVGAQIALEQKSPHEQTFAPNEQATTQDLLKGLGQIVLAAGMESVPGLSGVEETAPASRPRPYRGNRPVPTDFSASALDALSPTERSSLLDKATPSELRYAQHSYGQANEALSPKLGTTSPERIASDQAAAQAYDAARAAQQQQLQSLMAEVGPEGVAGARRHADRMSVIMRSIGVPTAQAHGDAMLESLLLRAEEARRAAGPPKFATGEVNNLIDEAKLHGGATGTQPAVTQEVTRPLPAGAPPVQKPETGFRLITEKQPQNLEDLAAKAMREKDAATEDTVNADMETQLRALEAQAEAARQAQANADAINAKARRNIASEGQRRANPIIKEFLTQPPTPPQPTLSDFLLDSFRELFTGKSKLKK